MFPEHVAAPKTSVIAHTEAICRRDVLQTHITWTNSQHVHTHENVVLRYMSLQCALHKFFVAATRPPVFAHLKVLPIENFHAMVGSLNFLRPLKSPPIRKANNGELIWCSCFLSLLSAPHTSLDQLMPQSLTVSMPRHGSPLSDSENTLPLIRFDTTLPPAATLPCASTTEQPHAPEPPRSIFRRAREAHAKGKKREAEVDIEHDPFAFTFED